MSCKQVCPSDVALPSGFSRSSGGSRDGFELPSSENELELSQQLKDIPGAASSRALNKSALVCAKSMYSVAQNTLYKRSSLTSSAQGAWGHTVLAEEEDDNK